VSQPAGDNLQITVQGKKEEDIFVHDVQLMQVTHKVDESALVDRKGEILIYKDPVLPNEATIGFHQNVNPEISVRDGKYYAFTNHAKGKAVVISYFDLKTKGYFHWQINCHQTPTGPIIFSQFKSLYGDSYPAFVTKRIKPIQKFCSVDQSSHPVFKS
jgi:hypothetical protein